MQSVFRWPDYLVFVAVLVISAAIGLFHACTGGKQKTTTEYFLGNRKLQLVPVGLSILVTFQSSILFVGIPAEIYTHGTSYLLFHIGMVVASLITAFLFVPLLFPLKLISSFEYLERRFQSKVARIIGSVLGMLNMMLYVGAVIFAPATAMEAVSGIPVWGSVVLIGVVATFYTTLGGLRAVIWTDVFQFSIMVIGLLGIFIQGLTMQGGMQRVWNQSLQGGRIDYGGISLDPRVRHTIWSLTIGGSVTWLANIACNQSNVQRFSSVPTMTGAKLAVLVAMPGFVIFGCIASLIGLIVYSYNVDVGCDPLAAGNIQNPNQLVPIFVMQVFEFLPGFSGLFVASLFCASLSTVSSTINGLAAMTWEDIFKMHCTKMSQRKTAVLVKCFGFFHGTVAITMAFLSLKLGGPATQIALSFFGASGGPLLGMFLLGAFFPCANWIGVSTGALTGLFLCLWIAIGSYSIPPLPSLEPAPTYNCEPHLNGNNSLHYNNGLSWNLNYTTHNLSLATLSPSDIDSDPVGLESFYRISYLWYSVIGLLTVIVVGLIVSFLTGAEDPQKIQPELLISPLKKIASVLPASIKNIFSCDRCSPLRRYSSQEDREGTSVEQTGSLLTTANHNQKPDGDPEITTVQCNGFHTCDSAI